MPNAPLLLGQVFEKPRARLLVQRRRGVAVVASDDCCVCCAFFFYAPGWPRAAVRNVFLLRFRCS